MTQYILNILWHWSTPVAESFLYIHWNCLDHLASFWLLNTWTHILYIKKHNCSIVVCFFFKMYTFITPYYITEWLSFNILPHFVCCDCLIILKLWLHCILNCTVIASPPGCDDVAFFLFLIIAVNTVSPRNRTLLMNPVPSYTKCPMRAELQSQSLCLSSLMHRRFCCRLVPLKMR